MAGATRSRMRNESVSQPVSPSDDGTIADAPFEGNAACNAYTPSREPEGLSARDGVSRLSASLEPLHLVGQDGELHPEGQ